MKSSVSLADPSERFIIYLTLISDSDSCASRRSGHEVMARKSVYAKSINRDKRRRRRSR